MKKILISILVVIFSSNAKAQNVGIGTSNPNKARLVINGAVGYTTAIFGGETTGISLQSNFPTIGFNEYFDNDHRHIANGYAGQIFLDPNSGYMAFDMFTSGNANAPAVNQRRLLTLISTGNIVAGAGETSLGINFTPITNSQLAGVLQVKQTLFSNDIGIALINRTTNDAWRMSTVVGTAVPGFLEFDYNGVTKGIFKQETGEYVNLSDRRLKENIQGLSPVLDKVMMLEPVRYNFIKQQNATSPTLGFIAQDIKVYFPELVTVIDDASRKQDGLRDLHTLNYNGFGVIAIKAVQEQQKIIEQLVERIESLERAMK